MLVTLGTPDVVEIPNTRKNVQVPNSDAAVAADDGEDGEAILKICTSYCGEYLYVLTAKTLFIYTNSASHLPLGVFDHGEYEEFSDLTPLPGFCQICIKTKSSSRFLLARLTTTTLEPLPSLYKNAGLIGVASLADSLETDSPRWNSPRSSPEFSRTIATPQGAAGDHSYPKSDYYISEISQAPRLKMLKDHFHRVVVIQVKYTLILPSPILCTSTMESQMLFWLHGQLGVYITLCPVGFLNYLNERAYNNMDDAATTHLALFVHSTNLLQDLMVTGSVDETLGLLYLNFSRMQVCNDINLYVTDARGVMPNSLHDWMKFKNQSSEDGTQEFELSGILSATINAQEVLRAMVAFGDDDKAKPGEAYLDLEPILGTMIARQIEFVERCNTSLIVTSMGALLGVYMCNAPGDSIGVILSHSGIKSISVSESSGLVSALEENSRRLHVYTCYGYRYLWTVELDDVTSHCWVANHLIVALETKQIVIYDCVSTKITTLTVDIPNVDLMIPACFNYQLLLVSKTFFVCMDLYLDDNFSNKGRCIKCTTSFESPYKVLFGYRDMLIVSSCSSDCCFGSFFSPLDDLSCTSASANNSTMGDAVGGTEVSSIQNRLLIIPTPCVLNGASINKSGTVLVSYNDTSINIYQGEWQRLNLTGMIEGIVWVNDDIYLVLAHDDTEWCCLLFYSWSALPISSIKTTSKPVALTCCSGNSSVYILGSDDLLTAYRILANGFEVTFQEGLGLRQQIRWPIVAIYVLGPESFSFALQDCTGNIYNYNIKEKEMTKTCEMCNILGAFESVRTEKLSLICNSIDVTLIIEEGNARPLVAGGDAKLFNVASLWRGKITRLINNKAFEPSLIQGTFLDAFQGDPLGIYGQFKTSPRCIEFLDFYISYQLQGKRLPIRSKSAFDHKSLLSCIPEPLLMALVAILYRKQNDTKNLGRIEDKLGISVKDAFYTNLQFGQADCASLLLLAVQMLVKPSVCRLEYCKPLIDELLGQVLIGTCGNSLELLHSVLCFYNKDQRTRDYTALEIAPLVANLVAHLHVLGLMKLGQALQLQFDDLLSPISADSFVAVPWGICTPISRCSQSSDEATGVSTREDAPTTTSKGKPKVTLVHLVLSLLVQMDLTSNTNALDRSWVNHKLLAMLQNFYMALIRLRAYRHAFAIALATRNMLAIVNTTLLDDEVATIIESILKDDKCPACAHGSQLIAMLIHQAKVNRL